MHLDSDGGASSGGGECNLVNKVKTVLVKTPEGEKYVSVPQGTKAVLQDPNAEACGSMRTAPRCVLSLRSRTTTLFERMRCPMESLSFRV